MLLNTLCFPGWLAVCAVLPFVFAFPQWQDCIFLGIEPSALAGDPDLMHVGKWTALCCIPLLANGMILERSRQIELFSLLRVKKKWVLRLREVLACIVCTATWCVGVCMAAAWQLGFHAVAKIMLLLLPNLLLWSGIALACYALSRERAHSAVLSPILLIACCLIAGRFPGLILSFPSSWGMLCFTDYGGRPLLMAAASTLSATIFYLIFLFSKEDGYGDH